MKRSTIAYVIAAVCGLALAGYCGYAFCTGSTLTENPYTNIPVYICFLIVCAFLTEIVHELGHFFVGLACKMGVGAPKINVFKSSSVTIAPKGDKNLKARMIATSSAGLALQLIVIALGVLPLFLDALPVELCAALPYALYSFVLNVAPVEYKSGQTDGLVVVELLKNSPSAQVMLAVLKVQAQVKAGKELKDVDESLLLNLPQLCEDDPYFIILTELRYEYYKAKGDGETAAKYFARYEEIKDYLPDGYTD